MSDRTVRTLVDRMADALSSISNLENDQDRLQAYMRAKVDLKEFGLCEIRDADGKAKLAELSRRVSRS